MSANKYKPHVIVIPEDDADRQLANGFAFHPAVSGDIDVRLPAGGWLHVLDVFEQKFVPHLHKFRAAHVILLLDFDKRGENRRTTCEKRIPDAVKARTFLIGTNDEPEDFKKAVNMTFEQIGLQLADGCGRDDLGLWTHPHLVHNLAEVQRMRPIVHPILFPGA